MLEPHYLEHRLLIDQKCPYCNQDVKHKEPLFLESKKRVYRMNCEKCKKSFEVDHTVLMGKQILNAKQVKYKKE